jgi:hypothetical protein
VEHLGSVDVSCFGWRMENCPVGSGRTLWLVVEELDQRHQGHQRGLAAAVQKPSDGHRVQSSLSAYHPRRHVSGIHCIAQPVAEVPLDDPARYPNVIHSTATIWRRTRQTHRGIPGCGYGIQGPDAVWCCLSRGSVANDRFTIHMSLALSSGTKVAWLLLG